MRKILIFLTFALFLAASGIAGAEYLVWIRIDSENVTFANHSDSLIEGNWIELSGGTLIEMPQLTLVYNGVNNTVHTHGGKTIVMNASLNQNADFSIRYPLSRHAMYTNVSGKKLVNATFYGNSSFASQRIDTYLISTSPTELRDVLEQAIDGNTTPFRNMLNNSVYDNLNQSLNASGDLQIISREVNAGDYVVVVKLNETNSNLTILSATTFQVLEYSSTLTAPSSATTGDNVAASIELLNASGSFRYGAMIVHENAYNAELRLRSDGTRSGTNLTADGEFLVQEMKIVGVGLSAVNASKAKSIAEGVIGSNNGSVSYADVTSATSKTVYITTDGLNTGRYILIAGVWQTGGNRLVAFAQQNVTLSAPAPTPPPSAGGGGGMGGVPPSPELVIEITVSKSIEYGVAGRTYVLNVSYPGQPVGEVDFTMVQSTKDFLVAVQKLKEKPGSVSNAPGRVHSYLNIYIGLPGSFYKDVKIKFTVDREWLKKEGIAEDAIALFRYSDGTWTQLPTKIVSKDGVITYEAQSPELSIFAVSSIAVPPPTPTPTATPKITPTPTAALTPEITPTPKPFPGFEAAIAIASILLARKRLF